MSANMDDKMSANLDDAREWVRRAAKKLAHAVSETQQRPPQNLKT